MKIISKEVYRYVAYDFSEFEVHIGRIPFQLGIAFVQL